MHDPLIPNCLENSEFEISIYDIIIDMPAVCPEVALFSNVIASSTKDASIRKIVPELYT